jgi:hypothetical protein
MAHQIRGDVVWSQLRDWVDDLGPCPSAWQWLNTHADDAPGYVLWTDIHEDYREWLIDTVDGLDQAPARTAYLASEQTAVDLRLTRIEAAREEMKAAMDEADTLEPLEARVVARAKASQAFGKAEDEEWTRFCARQTKNEDRYALDIRSLTTYRWILAHVKPLLT